MAYDKVVDSSVLDTGLAAIANAIREKGGTSDPIAFDAMSQAILDVSSAEDLDAVLQAQESKLEELLLAINLKSAGEGATIETWELTLNDGSVIEKRVVVA